MSDPLADGGGTVEIRTPVLQIAPEGKLMVRVHSDGTIEYGPDYKPDEAARALRFTRAVRGRA